MTINLTPASRQLFSALAEAAGNWGSMVPTDGNVVITKEERGNLTQLKRAGLVVTQQEDGSAWVLFTQAGADLAKELGIKSVEALA